MSTPAYDEMTHYIALTWAGAAWATRLDELPDHLDWPMLAPFPSVGENVTMPVHIPGLKWRRVTATVRAIRYEMSQSGKVHATFTVTLWEWLET